MERLTEHITNGIKIHGCKTIFGTRERKGAALTSAIVRLAAYEDALSNPNGSVLSPEEAAQILKQACVESFKQAAKIQLLQNEIPHWVPVSERLPEVDGEPSEFATDCGKSVLACDDDGYVYETTFWKYSQTFQGGTPKYWMEKPKPPKGEK